MTDNAHAPEPSEPAKRRRIEEPFYAITWQQAMRDFRDGILTPRGLIYCYFVTHLRPGAEMRVAVEELCALLEVHEATYYRAISALKTKGRLNIRRGRMTVGVPEIHPQSAQSQLRELNSQDCESNSQICESNSQICENANQANPLQDKGSRSSANVPITNKEILETNKQLVPTHHPVCLDINRGDIGTASQDDLQQLVARIGAAGIPVNKTIHQTLLELSQAKDPAAARQVVENALSALQEQQKHGTIRNPGGFLRAALQRGFTANEAKRTAREKRQEQRDPPNLVQLSAVIDQALANGDRPFALSRLQTLWDEGWQPEITELVQLLRPDWHFVVTEEGISDAD